MNRSVSAFLAGVAAAAAMVLTAPHVRAEPVPEHERLPVDIRRATFVVRDIDKSLPLYRDTLGLKVVYDQLIGGGTDGEGRPVPPSLRLVLLRANDTFVGALGLMQRFNEPPAPAPVLTKAGAGKTILVVNVGDLDERWPRIAATPHIVVETPPKRVEYPAPGGGTIAVMFSAVWDADGNYIELNKLLGSPAGVSGAKK